MCLKLLVRVPRGPFTCTVRDLMVTSHSDWISILLLWYTVFMVESLTEAQTFAAQAEEMLAKTKAALGQSVE